MTTPTFSQKFWITNPTEVVRGSPPRLYTTAPESDMAANGWLLYAEQSFSMPPLPADTVAFVRAGSIAAFEEEIRKTQAAAEAKVTTLRGLINNLLAIEGPSTTTSDTLNDGFPF